MKTTAAFLVLSGALALGGALAQARTGSGTHAAVPDGVAGEPISLGSTSESPDTLRGRCSIKDGNTLAPCADTMLVLNDAHGKELARTRTGTKGGFKFAADASQSYSITASSKLYDVVAPQSLVKPGTVVELVLRQK